ncbi:MAG: hypothetical protein HY327_08250 [Chloroflexi bacterium]|nr:hypothetical protein [Chloroflexota bacterium]
MKRSIVLLIVLLELLAACAPTPMPAAPQPTELAASATQPASKNFSPAQESPRALPAQTAQPKAPPLSPQPKAQGGTLAPADRDKLRAQEKSFLPQVTAVEKWNEIATVGEPENFAPSIVKLREGGYRIFWNSVSQKGITSATSKDGIAFAKDSGVRLNSGGAGQKDCIASHPWVVALEAGYRMYYQGDAFCEMKPGVEHEYRIFSAFSTDGMNFTREGVRVDLGANGLTQAAHGRVLRLADGTYRMWFSANFAGKNQPADILGASSKDGLTWTLDTKPMLERGHDPTVIKLGNKIYVYTTFLGDNFVILESSDGFNFTPTSWVDFYAKNGARIEEFGDVDILQIATGRLLMYGSGKGSQGVSVMEKSGVSTAAPPWNPPNVTTQQLLDNARVANAQRYQFAIDKGARILPTSDGRSFYLLWYPDPKATTRPPMIATLSGHGSYAFDEFFVWFNAASQRGYGILALQWWFTTGEKLDDYYLPQNAYDIMAGVLREQNIAPGRTLLHGFSRGSANIYGVTLYDRLSHNNLFGMTIANAGKASPDFPPNTDISAGRYGGDIFAGTHWVMYCGEKDPNPERDGCIGMRDARAWVQKFGGTVDLLIEDPEGDHGGFHRNAKNVNAALDVFQKIINSK